MCTRSCRKILIPKKFLCWSLRVGSICVGIVTCVILIIALICAGIQVYQTSQYKNNSFTQRNNYGYAVVSILYILFMLCLCLWFIWGVMKRKSSVVISWVVVTSMWLAQTFALLIVLLCLHNIDSDFIAWIIALIFGLLAIGILTWSLLIVLGYWYQLKEQKKAAFGNFGATS